MVDAEVSAADVRIEAMGVTARRMRGHVELTTSITLRSDNDDDAPNARCIVVLPPTSRVVSCTPPAIRGPEFPPVGPAPGFVQSTPVDGYVVFEAIDPLAVGGRLDLVVVTQVHESWAERPIAAFVHSSAPDPDPSNNFMTASAVLPGRRA